MHVASIMLGDAMKSLLEQETIQRYRNQGFIRIPHVLSEKEVSEFKALVIANRDQAQSKQADYRGEGLHRVVNAWRQDPAFMAITFHPRINQLALELAGADLRLWHDQVMIKPCGDVWTFIHQGQPNWSHVPRPDSSAITAWVALVDVPLEAGCMGYMPGSHRYWNLGQQMGHVDSFFDLAPELIDHPIEFVPLKAGDVAFHHANTVHCAAANQSNYDRIAATINFMDVDTQYRETPHAVTDGLGYQQGDVLDDEDLFPFITKEQMLVQS